MKRKQKNANRVSEGAWLQGYIDSPEKQTQLYRRTLKVVIFSQIFGGAGLAAGITVGALLAQDMIGTESAAGIPVALLTLGSAAAALLVGRISQRIGRGKGLAAGFFAGGLGAVGVIMAAVFGSTGLLFASLLVYGAGTATNLQARYAGTDLATKEQRATAVSMAMVSTTFGAVAGPNLVGVMGKFALSVGIPALAGPFILAAAAFFLAGLVLLLFLRPDPLIVSQAITKDEEKKRAAALEPGAETEKTGLNRKVVVSGAAIMVLTQFVMAAIMTMTPVHMGNHGHDLSAVGMVIGFHIGAMYLPSLVTGVLVDKVGRTVMAAVAGITLLLSGLLAAFAPADSLTFLVFALILLGMGWNFGLISGTALIVDATQPSVRAKTQGTVDVLLALSGASGGILSGIIVAAFSYATLALSGAALALLLIPAVIWSRKNADTNAA